MAIMNRNVNLEEINTDAFMGISYLNHQTIAQKVIFIAGVASGIGVNLMGTFLWNLSGIAMIGTTLIPLLIGVAFGCNYNEDLTLIKYFSLIVSSPVKHLYSMPTEDLEQIRNRAEKLKQEEEAKKATAERVSDDAQRKLLIKMLAIGIIIVAALVISIIIIKSFEVEELHHTVAGTASLTYHLTGAAGAL